MNKCRYICIYQRKLQINYFYGYLNILVFVVPPFIVINVLRGFQNTSLHSSTVQSMFCLACQ